MDHNQTWTEIANAVNAKPETCWSYFYRRNKGQGLGRAGRSGLGPAFPE